MVSWCDVGSVFGQLMCRWVSVCSAGGMRGQCVLS